MGNNPALTANPLMMAQLMAAQQNALMAGGQGNQQLAKKQRELYVGNIPLGSINSATLKEFLDTACEAAFGVTAGMKPVITAEINASGTFAFVEFRTPDLATQALQLSGISMMGRDLRIARPSVRHPGLKLNILPP